MKGMVRRVSHTTLRDIEANAQSHDALSTLSTISLIDSGGSTAVARLVHFGNLVAAAENSPAPDALKELRAVKSALATPAVSPPDAPVLYVRDGVCATKAEIERRQTRTIWKHEGRLLAANVAEASAFVKDLLAKHQGGAPPTEWEVCVFRGLVEELCVRGDAETALALAINPRLPLLNSAASAALAKVPTTSPAAVRAFLDGFAAKDDQLPACETCATQLARRLRREEDSDSQAARENITACMSFNVDPSSVFPADAVAIQNWASQYITSNMGLEERAESVRQRVRKQKLLPRRMAIDSLSIWCMTDLGRSWVRESIGDVDRHSIHATSPVLAASQQTALSYVLKDPKRNLVDARLLHQYAQLLHRGDILPTCESFPAFLEECGESHGEDERPVTVSFTMPLPNDVESLHAALRRLAPRCSYWTTLLDHYPERFAAFAAPFGEVQVEVSLPVGHESVAAASEVSGAMPPVLFEDDHVIVVDKPAGIATTCHALSSTQAGSATTDLLSLVLKHRPEMQGCFRQGQVHRLDTMTSGCLIFSKSMAAADSLRHQMGTSGAFSIRRKVYVTLCRVLEPELSRVPLHGEMVDPSDSKVHTRYRILRYSSKNRIAMVECRFQQGKKHQIRRHLASAGLPILADTEHGGACCCTPLIRRVALHAASISFVHPILGEAMCVSAPLPDDFHRALRIFGA